MVINIYQVSRACKKTEQVNEHKQMQPSCVFPFFLQENKGKGLTRGWTAFSALHIYRHSNNTSALALQSTNLCFCTMDREAFRGKAKRQHMQVQAASSCLLIQSDRPVFTSGSKCPSLLWLEGEKNKKNKQKTPHTLSLGRLLRASWLWKHYHN